MNVNLFVTKTSTGATVNTIVDAPNGITGGDFVAQYDVDRWDLPVAADLSSPIGTGGCYVQNLGNGEIKYGVPANEQSAYAGNFITLYLRKKADAPEGPATFGIVKEDLSQSYQTGAEDKDNTPYTMESFAAVSVQ